MQRERGHRIRQISADFGRPIKSHTQMILILAETDAQARRMFDRYVEGADVEAIQRVWHTGAGEKSYDPSSLRLFYGGAPVVGGPETAADKIEELLVDCEIDGILFCFPDFIEGLEIFGARVMPILRRRGLVP